MIDFRGSHWRNFVRKIKEDKPGYQKHVNEDVVDYIRDLQAQINELKQEIDILRNSDDLK